ncbi:MAG: V-type ATP synthase subunit K [Clostridia bacterium]|nr:V-type ATP synthase subunit K [Clostridia bacterium]
MESITSFLLTVFSGQNLALLGAALAAGFSGWGSARGVSLVAETASGLLSEDPSKFGKALALEALPMTQGVYGLVAAFLVIWKIGLFGEPVALTAAQGGYFLMACLPFAIVGYHSAIRQARAAAAGISLLAKRPDELGKAITNAALVETYAIFALLITMLLIFNAPIL